MVTQGKEVKFNISTRQTTPPAATAENIGTIIFSGGETEGESTIQQQRIYLNGKDFTGVKQVLGANDAIPPSTPYGSLVVDNENKKIIGWDIDATQTLSDALNERVHKISNPTNNDIALINTGGGIKVSGVQIATAAPTQSSDDSTIPTSAAVASAIATAITGISGALIYKGTVSSVSDLASAYTTAETGYVYVANTNFEAVMDGVIPQGLYEKGDYFIRNNVNASISGFKFDCVSGENQVYNNSITLATCDGSVKSAQTIATVDGTAITVKVPTHIDPFVTSYLYHYAPTTNGNVTTSTNTSKGSDNYSAIDTIQIDERGHVTGATIFDIRKQILGGNDSGSDTPGTRQQALKDIIAYYRNSEIGLTTNDWSTATSTNVPSALLVKNALAPIIEQLTWG